MDCALIPASVHGFGSSGFACGVAEPVAVAEDLDAACRALLAIPARRE